jgi:Bacterial conjugation TrbI-like protein
MPNGKLLERQPGADTEGYAGLEDEVDNHWGMLFKAANLSTLPSVGSEAGTSDNKNSLWFRRTDPAPRKLVCSSTASPAITDYMAHNPEVPSRTLRGLFDWTDEDMHAQQIPSMLTPLHQPRASVLAICLGANTSHHAAPIKSAIPKVKPLLPS